MLYAYDTITKRTVSAKTVAENNIDEPFRYECLCCGEEVHIAAKRSSAKTPHFRHLHGNSDKDCDLYLGGLLQTGNDIARAEEKAQQRSHSHTEVLFDASQHVFYLSVSFSEEKIEECQKEENELEIKTGSVYSLKPLQINKSNFAHDSPVRFPLKLISNTCTFSIRSKKSGSSSTSYLELLKPVDFPTFFKFPSNEDNTSLTKRIIDGIIYTETRYYIIAIKKSQIDKLIKYISDVSVGHIEEITAFGTIIYGAEITISAVSTNLYETMNSYGYKLRKSERVTVLWPPVYSIDGEIHSNEKYIVLSSTFELRPRGNISCDVDQIERFGEIYTIDLSERLRINSSNITIQINPESLPPPVLRFESKNENAMMVDVNEGHGFYEVGKAGYIPLPPGCYHLTKGKKIIQFEGTYPTVVFTLPEFPKATPDTILKNIRRYYNVLIPYSDELFDGIELSQLAIKYIDGCRITGAINAKVVEYIMAGII